MIRKGPSVDQASYDLTCRMLRGALLDAVQAGPEAMSGIGSVQLRASAALYGLLLDHPIDKPGRCRSCRPPGALFGWRRRRCRVHIKAAYWLHQQNVPFLLSQLAGELRRTATGAPATNRDAADVLPRIELDVGIPPTQPSQAPAVSPPLPPQRFPRAGRPDPTHGGTGVNTDSPRSRRVPPGQFRTALDSGSSLLLTGVTA